MSYILDALRKAEAERQRGAVPGLHDQAGAAGLAAVSDAGQRRGRRLPLIIGLLVVAVALMSVLMLNRGLWPGAQVPPAHERERQAGPAQAPAGAQTVQSPAPAAGVTVAQAPVPPATMPAPGPSSALVLVPAPSPAPAPAAVAAAPAEPAAPAVPRAPAAVARSAPPRDAVPAAPKLAPAGKAAAPPPVSAPAPQPVLRLADLPEAQRRELPPMVVSGAVQSPDPASRMLILDGQVLREGDAPAPGLLLERIGPRAAVFSRGGVRFEIPL